jgi:hypothetical protein
MVLPIFSSCCPGGQYPSMRRLGALPILILEDLLPPMRRVISRKRLSRRGAFATVMSHREDMPSWRHRRLWLTRQSLTSPGLRWWWGPLGRGSCHARRHGLGPSWWSRWGIALGGGERRRHPEVWHVRYVLNMCTVQLQLDLSCNLVG